MEIATMTDAVGVPGTEVYYLWHIYVVLILILLVMVAWMFRSLLRSAYTKLSKRKDLD